jgi:hypothetical protein
MIFNEVYESLIVKHERIRHREHTPSAPKYLPVVEAREIIAVHESPILFSWFFSYKMLGKHHNSHDACLGKQDAICLNMNKIRVLKRIPDIGPIVRKKRFSNTIFFDRLSRRDFGSLISNYQHAGIHEKSIPFATRSCATCERHTCRRDTRNTLESLPAGISAK